MTEAKDRERVVTLYFDESKQSIEANAKITKAATRLGLTVRRIPSSGLSVPSFRRARSDVTYSWLNETFTIDRGISDMEFIYGPKEGSTTDREPAKNDTI